MGGDCSCVKTSESRLLSVTIPQLLSGDDKFRFILTTGECALGVPLELLQTIADMRRTALTGAESANVFTQQNAALVAAIRFPLANLPRIAGVADGGVASSSALAFSYQCELRMAAPGSDPRSLQ